MSVIDKMLYSAQEPLTIHRDEVGVTAEALVPPIYWYIVAFHWHSDVVSLSDDRAAFNYKVTPRTVSRWRNLLVKHGYVAATRREGNQYDYQLLRLGNF